MAKDHLFIPSEFTSTVLRYNHNLGLTHIDGHPDIVVVKTDGYFRNGRFEYISMFGPTSRYNDADTFPNPSISQAHATGNSEIYAVVVALTTFWFQLALGDINKLVIMTENEQLIAKFSWDFYFAEYANQNEIKTCVENAALLQQVESWLDMFDDLGIEVKFWPV